MKAVQTRCPQKALAVLRRAYPGSSQRSELPPASAREVRGVLDECAEDLRRSQTTRRLESDRLVPNRSFEKMPEGEMPCEMKRPSDTFERMLPLHGRIFKALMSAHVPNWCEMEARRHSV